MMSQGKGLFVTIEGVEGTGKSTLTSRLIQDLQALNLPSIATREPGGSSIGTTVRSLLLNSTPGLPALNERAEALLFAADRAQHVAELIKPSVEDGKIVVCDRFLDSSAAYQGVGRGLGAKTIRDISVWASQDFLPDITFLVDLDPLVGIKRKSADEVNRMELEPIEFHQKIREAFLGFSKNPDTSTKWYVMSGHYDLEVIYNALKTIVLLSWVLKNIYNSQVEYLSKIQAILDTLRVGYDRGDMTYGLETTINSILKGYLA